MGSCWRRGGAGANPFQEGEERDGRGAPAPGEWEKGLALPPRHPPPPGGSFPPEPRKVLAPGAGGAALGRRADRRAGALGTCAGARGALGDSVEGAVPRARGEDGPREWAAKPWRREDGRPQPVGV